MKAVYIVLALLAITAYAEYDPSLSELFIRSANLAYCCGKDLIDWSCGNSCKNLEGIVEFISWTEKPAGVDDGVAFVVLKDLIRKFIIIAFRGTNTTYQLLLEGTAEANEEYTLHEIEDACVQSIFYDRYNIVREDLLAEVQQLYAQYSDFTFVFTGHSLGAALSTHAALDIALSNLVPASQIINYNYGSPRVGNYAFSQKYNEVIPVNFRVIHWNDIFITWPVSCDKDSNNNCITGQSNSHYGVPGGDFYGWHTDGQIFYDVDMVSYQACTAEQPNCADQWHSIFERSIPHHLNYLGIPLGCGSAEIPSFNSSHTWKNIFGDTSACVHLPHVGVEDMWKA